MQKVLRGYALLDEAAIRAVRQWRYAPFVLNRRATPIIQTVLVNFATRVTPAGSGTGADGPGLVTPLTAEQSAGRARLAAHAGDTHGDWSAPVEGLRGRRVVATVADAGGSRVRLELGGER